MNRRRIRAIVHKEWAEARQNRVVVMSMAILPLIMLVVMWGTALLLIRDPSEVEQFVPPAALSHLTPVQAFVVLMNDQYVFYLLIAPMLLPVTMAAYSIVGEKESRSLEPLLATPIATRELLAGKVLSAVLPAAVIGWVSFVLAVVVMWPIAGWAVTRELVRPMWIVGIVLLSPLLALITSLLGTMVSARAKDVRAAQAIGGLGIGPVLAISLVVLLGEVYLTAWFMLVVVGVLVPIAVLLFWVVEKRFQREEILTRWK